MLCGLQVVGRNTVLNTFGNAMFFTVGWRSFLILLLIIILTWRSFLVLHAEGFVREGRPNLQLFSRLFWLLFGVFMVNTFWLFPGSLMWRGDFPKVRIISNKKK